MATAVELWPWLQQHWGQPWLVGLDAQRFWQVLAARLAALEASPHPAPLVLVAESNPLNFLAGALAAIARQAPVVFANPSWGEREWQQLSALLQPHITWPEAVQLGHSSPASLPPAGSILIPTGGSSGTLKFARHTWHTLSAAAVGFQRHFQLSSVNAYCLLPLYHVSGFMQVVRVITANGVLAVQSFRELIRHQLPVALPKPACISLVPTQLQRLLTAQPSWAHWLAQFDVVLLGGAPPWPELLQLARQRQIPLALTYGMTETAAQVAALRPSQFLAGATGMTIMPHAAVTIRPLKGSTLPSRTGPIQIQSAALCQGYWSPLTCPQLSGQLLTDDLGYFDSQGYLHVVGRASRQIISGGENISPAEVEAALRATGQVEDVSVLGLPDTDWGQVVTAVVVLRPNTDLPSLIRALQPSLSRYKQPKHWIAVPTLPRNAQGKINQAVLLKLAQTLLQGRSPQS